MSKQARVQKFKAFLVANEDLGVKECISIASSRYHLTTYEAEGLINAWVAEGVLRKVRQDGRDGPGRPKLVVTKADPTPSSSTETAR